MQSSPEAVDAATVDISFILVPSAANLVEVPQSKPPGPLRRFMPNQLIEKVVFPVRSGGAIDTGNLKISLAVGV
jgi:hypothetical protein